MNRYSFDEKKHCHTLDSKPLYGTSTVVQVLSKNLAWWSAELSAIECLEVGEKIPNIRSEYLEAVASPDKKKAIDALQKKYPLFKKARFAHYNSKNDKAEKGIDLHYWLEQFVKFKMGLPNEFAGLPQEVAARIDSFVSWSLKNVKQWLWSEACCYSEKHWVGGIADAGALLNDDTIALIDFKSAKEPYFNHWCQTAGYAIEIEENGLFDKIGKSLGFIPNISSLIIVPFGAENVIPVFNPMPIKDYKDAFVSCVNLNRIIGQADKLSKGA